jgi:hypothetical protein
MLFNTGLATYSPSSPTTRTAKHGGVSSQQLFDQFAGCVAGTSVLSSAPSTFIANKGAGAVTVASVLTAVGLAYLPVTGLIVGKNSSDVWACTAPVSGSLPSLDTVFTRVAFTGVEEIASGNLAG